MRFAASVKSTSEARIVAHRSRFLSLGKSSSEPAGCTMPRVFSPRAEPLRRGAADEGVDAAADDDDDGHRCEHAHDEDDVRRLPSSSDAGFDDQLSGLAGVQMRTHVGSRRDGVDDDDDDDDDYDDDDGVVFSAGVRQVR